MGAPLGNHNAAKSRIWSDAIRKALLDAEREDAPHAIRKIVMQLLTKAAEGDMAAIKEMGDRLDGKPVQAIDADIRGNLTQTLLGLPKVEPSASKASLIAEPGHGNKPVA